MQHTTRVLEVVRTLDRVRVLENEPAANARGEKEMSDHRVPLRRDVEPPSERLPPVLQTTINVRSTSLAVLALIAVIGLLYLAKAVFIPITIAVVASYALTPVVDWLKRRARLPKAVGAGLTLAAILVGLGFGVESLQSEAIQILDIVPRATEKFGVALRRNALGPPGAVEKMQRAASEIEKAAHAAATTSKAPLTPATTAARAPADASAFSVWDYLVMGTASALAGIGQLVVVVALVYFLLIAGDSFRRTLMRNSGDTLSKKKITLQILEEINSQIQRYLLVQLATSALLGVVVWLAFVWIGLDNALFWACVGGVLHLIPYAGPTAFVFLVGLVAYAQFASFQPVVLVIGSVLAIVGVIGLLLVPWLTQRVGRLNAVTVFVALLVWGWLWGIWGLLLGIPIVMAINAVCERVEELQPISEFLGYAPKGQKDAASSGNPAI
jgi:predicted PurR-regulated permease PerM